MRLEDALSRIDNVVLYKNNAYNDLSYWNIFINKSHNCPNNSKYVDKNHSSYDSSLELNINETIYHHKVFYSKMDMLIDLSQSKFPDLKEYDNNASMWVKFKKNAIRSSYVAFSGMMLGAISLFTLQNFDLSSSLMATSIVGALFGAYYQKASARYEKEKHVACYIDKFSQVFAKYKYFNKKNIGIFEKSLNEYILSLNKLIEFVEINSLNKKRIDGLRDNYIELQLLSKDFKNIICSIKANKPDPIMTKSIDIRSATYDNLKLIYRQQDKLLKDINRNYSSIFNS